MDLTLPLANLAALFSALFVLAAIPSVSVLAVTARAAAGGFAQGAATAAGIVAGDTVFILLAIYGLSMLAAAMDELFVLVKYLGGAYLIWLATTLWRARAGVASKARERASGALASFTTGLLITLGDQKAIVFYLGFFPAFLDVTTLTALDAGVIVAIAAVAVGGAKLTYAFLAGRASRVLQGSRATRLLNVAAAGVLSAAGAFLLIGA